jgi:hypothetical protein
MVVSGSGRLAEVLSKPYWREAEARVVVDALTRAGEPLATFCRRHGVATERVRRWRDALSSERSEAERPGVRWAEVVVERRAAAGPDAAVEVVLRNGVELRFQAGVDTEYVAALACRLSQC